MQLQDDFPGRYREELSESQWIRQGQFDQISSYLEGLQEGSHGRREAFLSLDYSNLESYMEGVKGYRLALGERLGYPPPGDLEESIPSYELTGEDDYATIYRMRCEVLEGVEVYGLLFVPRNLQSPAPLLIAQHGGGGAPELVAGFGPSCGNYGWMIHRGVTEGFVVWAPALAFRLGGTQELSAPDRGELDLRAKHLGTSLLSIEIRKITRGLDAVLDRPEVDSSRVGMVGLSYGGLYTLYTAALETRISAAASSCFFNSRWLYPKEDWNFFNILNEFADPELCSLICPRALWIEVGMKDDLFKVEGARAEAPRASRHWKKLGIEERFAYREFDGGHEFWGDGVYEFIRRFLRG